MRNTNAHSSMQRNITQKSNDKWTGANKYNVSVTGKALSASGLTLLPSCGRYPWQLPPQNQHLRWSHGTQPRQRLVRFPDQLITTNVFSNSDKLCLFMTHQNFVGRIPNDDAIFQYRQLPSYTCVKYWQKNGDTNIGIGRCAGCCKMT